MDMKSGRTFGFSSRQVLIRCNVEEDVSAGTSGRNGGLSPAATLCTISIKEYKYKYKDVYYSLVKHLQCVITMNV